MDNPRISVCIPIHDMANGEYFLKRALRSLEEQTYRNFDVVITKEGKMAKNTNAAIRKSSGDIIKILYMDDYLYSPYALQRIADSFTGGWLATGCTHTKDGLSFFNDHMPCYNDRIRFGANTIGSPSVVAFANDKPLLFDENLSFLLDCDLYARLYERYGPPTLLETIDVAIGIGDHQTTNLMSHREKADELEYLVKRYVA